MRSLNSAPAKLWMMQMNLHAMRLCPNPKKLYKAFGGRRKMAELTNIEAVTRTLQEELRRDPRIFITGEDVGRRGGVFRVTKGMIEEFGEKRIIDSPLSEGSIIAVGI